MTIGPFRGEWRFLSNFWQEPRRRMLTNEHFYQAAKTYNVRDRALIMRAVTPGEAKRIGSQVTVREDWKEICDTVMLEGVRTKFYADDTLADRLLDTGNTELVELNQWGDVYWGVDQHTGKGLNKFGDILMQVRAEIRFFRA